MPRSPSRDLADRFDGNRRYFHRSDPTRRGKYLLAGIVLVLAVWWVVADVAFPSRAAYSHTHGPVANVHAAWDSNCAACHTEHSVSEVGVVSVFHARDRWHLLTCENCHTGAAHHNADVNDDGREFHAHCSNCHHEHNGREHSLVRISDSHCTGCHADLGNHHDTGTPKCAAKVTSFTRGHPEFRALMTQPERTLKFSHALHMTPGQVREKDGKEAMTLVRLRELSGPDAAKRYRKFANGDDKPIELDCASCHRLDSSASPVEYDRLKQALDTAGEPVRTVLPARPAGAHFLPVNFEIDCRACHPLRAPDGKTGAVAVEGFTLAHRKQPAELNGMLKAGYLRELTAKSHSALNAPAEPGGWLDYRPTLGARTIREEVARLTAAAKAHLFSPTTNLKQHMTEGCSKCHDVDDSSHITPLPDRVFWLSAARFDHVSHRGLTCLTCHPGTDAGKEFAEKERPQLPKIDSCRACHSPAGTRVNLPEGETVTGGGVRHGCVDCHRYHNGDHPLQGRGADAMLPERQQTLSISQFLRGKKD